MGVVTADVVIVLCFFGTAYVSSNLCSGKIPTTMRFKTIAMFAVVLRNSLRTADENKIVSGAVCTQANSAGDGEVEFCESFILTDKQIFTGGTRSNKNQDYRKIRRCTRGSEVAFPAGTAEQGGQGKTCPPQYF